MREGVGSSVLGMLEEQADPCGQSYVGEEDNQQRGRGGSWGT